MPQNTSDTKSILDWFSDFKEQAFFSLMSQYTPFGDIKGFPELNRKLTKREYSSVLDYANALDITNLYFQDDKSSSTEYIPSWDY